MFVLNLLVSLKLELLILYLLSDLLFIRNPVELRLIDSFVMVYLLRLLCVSNHVHRFKDLFESIRFNHSDQILFGINLHSFTYQIMHQDVSIV